MFEYTVGTDLSLACLVTPAPPTGSQFDWSCSTGCFADMQMRQNISIMNLNLTDSGVITCSVNYRGTLFYSESIELRVAVMGKKANILYELV